jgi:Mlc titration factor MtfA (ptsG expression regulator)
VLREYGATNPGEFFAVATEAFFGRALDFRDHEPELHRPLVAFYRQDPAVRFERLVSSEGMMKTPHGPVRIRLSTPPSGESS